MRSLTGFYVGKLKDKTLFLGMLLALSFAGNAQVQDSIELKSVIVSAEKSNGIPALKSVTIDLAIKDMYMSQNLGTLLLNHSSITIKDYGPSGIQTPTFRGMGASHTKIFLNGLDVSPASLGQSDLSILPNYLFSGVSLKFGNTAFTEGPGAIGGGVMLSTTDPLRKIGFSAELGSAFGSFKNQSYYGSLNYKGKNWESVTRYIYQAAENDFEYRNIAQPESPTVKQENAQKKLRGVSQSFNYQVNSHNSVSALVLAAGTQRNLPGIMTDNQASEQKQDDEMLTTQLAWKHYGAKSKSKMTFGYNWSSLTYIDKVANINSVTINKRFQWRENYTRTLNDKWALQTTGLLDYGTAQNPSLSGDTKRLQASVLVGFNGHLSKKWELGLFIQPTLNDTDLTMLPMASIAFLPTGKKNLIIGMNVSQNVHYPTLNDRFWVPGGNPDLKPEYATNGELNFHAHGDMKWGIKWDVDLAGFYGEVDDWILWKPTDKGYWSAQNIKSVQHSGGEVGLKLRKKIKDYTLNFAGNYQYVSAINKEVSDESLNKQLIYTPEHTANWLVGLQRKKAWVNVNYTYTGIRYITTSNSSYLPAYDLVNLSFGYSKAIGKINNLRFQFDWNNIFNKEYMSVVYRAMPLSNVLFTVQYNFN